jgi:hypothetical protein
MLASPHPDDPPALPDGFEILAVASSLQAHHYVCVRGVCRLRLCVRTAVLPEQESMIVLRDRHVAARLSATRRFERLLRWPASKRPPLSGPTYYQRLRLAQLLAVHDALSAGASPHELAFTLVFRNRTPLVGGEWKSAGERRHVHRLITDANQMVATGYRTLLLNS